MKAIILLDDFDLPVKYPNTSHSSNHENHFARDFYIDISNLPSVTDCLVLPIYIGSSDKQRFYEGLNWHLTGFD